MPPRLSWTACGSGCAAPGSPTRTKARGQVLRIGVRALEARRTGETLRLALDGDIDGEPVRLTGDTAPLERILAGDAPIPLNLRGQFLGLDLSADGALAPPGTGTQTRATLTLKAKTLKGLSPWLGRDLAALGPVDARFVLDGGGGRYTLAPLAVGIGPARADGQVSIDLKGRRPKVDLDLTLAELDLRPFLAQWRPGSDPTQGHVFSEAPLALDWMAALDLDARVQVRNLTSDPLAITDLDLRATLADRHLKLAATGKVQERRSLTLDLGLDTRGASPSLDLDLRGDKLMIAPLLAGTAAEGQVLGDLDARARLRASGPTAAAMASSLGGDVLLLVEGVEAPVQRLDGLGGGARVILGQILTPKSSTARIECGLVVLTFKTGRTEIKGVIDTPNSIVAGEGRLDLAKESIELRLVPRPKGVAILSVAAPVLVSGPLAAPDYRIEPGGLVTRLADLAARIVVPQLLLIDAFGQAGADSSCGKILAGEQSLGDGPRPLEAVRGAVGSALEAPGAVVRGAGEGVQGAGELIGGSRGPVRGAGGAVLEGTGELIKGVGGLLKGAGEAVKGVPQSGPGQGSEPGRVP